jgi:hypothetical protein
LLPRTMADGYVASRGLTPATAARRAVQGRRWTRDAPMTVDALARSQASIASMTR